MGEHVLCLNSGNEASVTGEALVADLVSWAVYPCYGALRLSAEHFFLFRLLAISLNSGTATVLITARDAENSCAHIVELVAS